jgi:hypothetical protein
MGDASSKAGKKAAKPIMPGTSKTDMGLVMSRAKQAGHGKGTTSAAMPTGKGKSKKK